MPGPSKLKGIRQTDGPSALAIYDRHFRPSSDSEYAIMAFDLRPLSSLEVLPPDIEPFRRGNTGIEFVTTFDSGKPGPHVMINALTHGNELCGAHALVFLLRHDFRPINGKLTLSFANVEAFKRFDPADPFASRYVDEDFNRLWEREVLHSNRQSLELSRARQLEPLVTQADFLLDIHSMHLSSPPLLMCGLQDKSIIMARGMGHPAHLVRDWGHQSGKRMRDFDSFDDPASKKTAMLVECGQHWERATVTVAIESALKFLGFCGIADPAFLASHIKVDHPKPQVLIDVSGPVTIKTDNFRFVESYQGLEVIQQANTLIGYDGEEEVRTPFDDCVLIMPGRHLSAGLSAVRLGRVVKAPPETDFGDSASAG